jgi:hypothetical protein
MRVLFTIVTFAAGVYTGAYFDQHYNLPKVPAPDEIMTRIKEYFEERKKPPKN